MRILEGGQQMPDVVSLLGEHLADMRGTSPEESVHALDLDALRAPGVTFLSARDASGRLLGVGALAEPTAPGVGHAEVKSMRTAPAARGRGVAASLLARLIELAEQRGHDALFLETGTDAFFAPAHRLYERAGFVPCGPFGGYAEDPHSRFYRLDLLTGEPGPA